MPKPVVKSFLNLQHVLSPFSVASYSLTPGTYLHQEWLRSLRLMTFSLVLVTRDAGSSSLEEGSKRGQFCSKHRVRAGKTDLGKGVGPPSSQGQHRELTSGPHLDHSPQALMQPVSIWPIRVLHRRLIWDEVQDPTHKVQVRGKGTDGNSSRGLCRARAEGAMLLHSRGAGCSKR